MLSDADSLGGSSPQTELKESIIHLGDLLNDQAESQQGHFLNWLRDPA